MKTFGNVLMCMLIPAVFGCVGSQTARLNSIELTNQLRPGMTYEEVVEIMGEPKFSATANDQWIVRWNLQEMWKGYVPYDFIFDPNERILLSWSENQEAYRQKQEQLGEIAQQIEKSESESSPGSQPIPVFENDTKLMQSFAGTYYSFSAVGGGQTGGTERKVTLCSNGSFRVQKETGYSSEAGTSDAWGTASQGSSTGTWRITGDMNSGTIVMKDSNGSSTSYQYERCASDCVYFGNTKFAHAGAPEC